jgi:hypothetical protein
MARETVVVCPSCGKKWEGLTTTRVPAHHEPERPAYVCPGTDPIELVYMRQTRSGDY